MKVPNLQRVYDFCAGSDPYDHTPSMSQDFVCAMKEVLYHHVARSPLYAKLVERSGFDLDSFSSMEDIEKIPFVPAWVFKKYEILSMAKEDVYLHLTSSGTSGQKSQIFFDRPTIESAQRMVDYIFKYYQWITPHYPCNYLLYTYAPEGSGQLGTAYTDNFLCKYAPVQNIFYALRNVGKEEHKFDLFGALDTLLKYEAEKIPVRIFGFPAFLYFTLEHMKKINHRPLKLNPESLVFLGGGWKGHQDRAIAKKALYALAGEMLGIPDSRLRDGFGSVEHCVPYIECQNHNFHVPTWSRVIIRDVKTLKNIAMDRPGYINFISPYITSMPAHSVLMGDLGILRSKSGCSCGLDTHWFEVVGRAGVSKNKSCAMAASDLLKEWER